MLSDVVERMGTEGDEFVGKGIFGETQEGGVGDEVCEEKESRSVGGAKTVGDKTKAGGRDVEVAQGGGEKRGNRIAGEGNAKRGEAP